MKYLRVNEYEKLKKFIKDKDEVSDDLLIIYNSIKSKINKSYSPGDYSNHTLKVPLSSNILNPENKEKMNMYTIFADHLLSMEYGGEKVYYIDEDVCNLLMDTKLTISSDFLELPFCEIYIEYLSDRIKSKENNSNMIGCFVNITKDKNNVRWIMIFCICNNDINAVISSPIPDCDDIHKCLFDLLNGTFEDMRPNFESNSYKTGEDDNNFFLKVIINTIIYIGCQNAELQHFIPRVEKEETKGKTRSQADKIRHEINKSTKMPCIYVGHRWADNEDREAHRFGKRTMGKEVLVSAFWRGQWYGARDSEDRKKVLIRVASYLRGAGLEPSNKIHIVK